jgi:hypothetical protein
MFPLRKALPTNNRSGAKCGNQRVNDSLIIILSRSGQADYYLVLQRKLIQSILEKNITLYFANCGNDDRPP